LPAPDGSLYFSEPSDNKIYRVDADDHITVLFDARVDDRQGERCASRPCHRTFKPYLRVPQAGPGKIGIAIVYPASEARFVAESYRGQSFRRPTTSLWGRNGGNYFTDPEMGRIAAAVYCVKPSGEVLRVTDNLESPTGFCSAATKRRCMCRHRSEYVWLST